MIIKHSVRKAVGDKDAQKLKTMMKMTIIRFTIRKEKYEAMTIGKLFKKHHHLVKAFYINTNF